MPTRSLQSAQVLLSGILDSAFMRSLQSAIATLPLPEKKVQIRYQAAGQLAAAAVAFERPQQEHDTMAHER